jgi:hypothetical protein
MFRPNRHGHKKQGKRNKVVILTGIASKDGYHITPGNGKQPYQAERGKETGERIEGLDIPQSFEEYQSKAANFVPIHKIVAGHKPFGINTDAVPEQFNAVRKEQGNGYQYE